MRILLSLWHRNSENSASSISDFTWNWWQKGAILLLATITQTQLPIPIHYCTIFPFSEHYEQTSDTGVWINVKKFISFPFSANMDKIFLIWIICGLMGELGDQFQETQAKWCFFQIRHLRFTYIPIFLKKSATTLFSFLKV